MRKLALTVALAAIGSVAFADTRTTYRDAQGRNMGSASPDRYGKTTYRDAQGRNMGSATTDRYGKTTYRDAQGRLQGTSSTDRYGKTTYRDVPQHRISLA